MLLGLEAVKGEAASVTSSGLGDRLLQCNRSICGADESSGLLTPPLMFYGPDLVSVGLVFEFVEQVETTRNSEVIDLPREAKPQLALGMERFSVFQICARRAWCVWNIVILVATLVSIAGVTTILVRKTLRTFRGKPGPELAIGRTLLSSVVAICLVDLLYHAPDILLVLDGDAAPLYYALRLPIDNELFQYSIVYGIIREAFGLLSLWAHTTVAFVIWRWIDKKRIRGPSKPMHQMLVLCVAMFTALRLTLSLFLRNKTAIVVQQLLHSGVCLPVFIVLITRFYVLTIIDLKKASQARKAARDAAAREDEERGVLSRGVAQDGGEVELTSADGRGGTRGPFEQQRGQLDDAAIARRNRSLFGSSDEDEELEMVLEGDESLEEEGEELASGGEEAQQGENRTAEDLQSSQDKRHRRLITQLTRISLVVSGLWAVACVTDLCIWIMWAVSGQRLMKWLFGVRVLSFRAVGLIDALSLGGFCTKRGTAEDLHKQRVMRRGKLSDYAAEHFRKPASFIRTLSREKGPCSGPEFLSPRTLDNRQREDLEMEMAARQLEAVQGTCGEDKNSQ